MVAQVASEGRLAKHSKHASAQPPQFNPLGRGGKGRVSLRNRQVAKGPVARHRRAGRKPYEAPLSGVIMLEPAAARRADACGQGREAVAKAENRGQKPSGRCRQLEFAPVFTGKSTAADKRLCHLWEREAGPLPPKTQCVQQRNSAHGNEPIARGKKYAAICLGSSLPLACGFARPGLT